jgi:hypothetical protein
VRRPLHNDAGKAPGVPAGRRRRSHATALDAGLLLLPLQLRPLIHHTSSRLHRGRPRPRQHANWLRHCCVTTASSCYRSPPRLGLAISQEHNRVRRHGVQPGLSRLLNGPLQLTIHSAISKFLRRLQWARERLSQSSRVLSCVSFSLSRSRPPLGDSSRLGSSRRSMPLVLEAGPDDDRQS